MSKQMPPLPVVGRFAPSPTGPLHFGSLVAAVASYVDAKHHNGRWLVRIEDIDSTRAVPGMAEHILQTLETFGFEWDGEVIWQHQRHDIYQQVLETLIQQGIAYACTCTRKEILDSSEQTGIEGPVYPGTCRQHPVKPGVTPAWRMRVPAKTCTFFDMLQGEITHLMDHEIGDFVLKRADGLFTYQLAVVVDDAMQGITHVVRGADLLHSTTRQICLQQALNFPTPQYAHIPLVRNALGQKLSKQTLATALTSHAPLAHLKQALHFLQRTPPVPENIDHLSDFWSWAIQHWQSYTIY